MSNAPKRATPPDHDDTREGSITRDRTTGAPDAADRDRPDGPGPSELAREQAYVTMLYDRLDTLRERASAHLAQAQRQELTGTHQARSERDTFTSLYADRLAQLYAVERGLCFGRLDFKDPATGPGGSFSRLYIGRLGLSDDEYEPLLIDWRAPAARPFYRATPASPEGVARRRHLRTSGRTVVGIDDDALDLAALSDTERESLNGEASLLASLAAGRTGRMTDIVATIQAEQDRVIRSEASGILVVQGGPGTGKTVVALHRAAYLLYTHRERMARQGVLVVGPNPTFLRYIEQVLPSLGETDVLLSTVEGLYPGVTVTTGEPDEVAAVKGDARMAGVIAAAVRARQEVPATHLDIRVGGRVLRLSRRACERARRRARRSRAPHNRARRVFVREVLTELAAQVVSGPAGRAPGGAPDGHDVRDARVPLDDAELADLGAELYAEPAVRAALDRLWPRLTPERLLTELFSEPERLAAAAPELTEAERALLLRAGAGGEREAAEPAWTPADVPLLDEAAELLGEDDAATRAARAAEEARREELAFAEDVLADLELPVRVDAGLLAEQYRGGRARATAAQRAAEDRTWTFGHVIVDEAQELSAMGWRMIMRRCPSRSMTVVGDIAQTGSPAGAGSWAEALDPYAAGRWREGRLSVNYRTPAEIMAVAADVLADVDPGLEPPTSVREAGEAPWCLRLEEAELGARLTGVVADEMAAVGDGRLAVIVPAARAEELGRLIAAAVPGAAAGGDPAALDAPAAVLTVAQARGLEFDAVVVVDPAGILAASARGRGDLYVALTRATRRLGVVHTGALPSVLSRLASSAAPAAAAAPAAVPPAHTAPR